MTRSLSSVALHLLALSLASTAALAQTATETTGTQTNGQTYGQTYGKFHFKTWEPLKLDASRVALKLANANDLAPVLSAAGLDLKSAQQWPIDGWWVISLPANVNGGVEGVVATLAAQPAATYASPVFIGLTGGPIWPSQDVIAGFAPNLGPAQHDALFTQAHVLTAAPGLAQGQVLDRDWDNNPGMDRVTAASKNGFEVLAAANALAQMPQALFAEPDMMITGTHCLIPNDPLFSDQWALNNTGQSGGVADMDMNGPEAWDITTGSSSVTVVILDIGVQLDHPDLNIASVNADFTGGGTGGYPGNSCDNHGTACAGCVAARINNSLGVTGIAPNCHVASARIGVSVVPCNGTWNGAISNTINALSWAQTNGYRVTSNSNAYGSTSSALDTAYTNAYNANIISFAAAGNGGTASLAYPASSPSVIACAAIDRTGTRASFSQYGTGLKFAAPGVSIDSTDRTGADGYVAGDYVTVDGTSFATPYTAGVAALVISANPALSSAQVEILMELTAKDRGPAGYDTGYGYGIPDAYNAVREAISRPSNDDCSSATTVVSGGVYTGHLDNATFNSADGQGSCGNPFNGPDIWYSFTAPGAGTLRVTTCGTNDTGGQDAGIDTILALFTTCGGSILDCNDDWTGTTTPGCAGLDAGLLRDSAVSAAVAPGQNVRIRVQRYGGAAAGAFTLNVFFTPVNDDCAAAIDVSDAASAGGSGLTLSGTLVGATNDGTATCGNSATNADVWYSFTAPAACTPGVLRVTTCGTHDLGGVDTGMDTVLSLHAGCGGAQLDCDDDWTSSPTPGCAGIDNGIARDSAVSATVTPGQTVLIRVSKFGSVASGPFLLNVFYTPVNDNCSGAIPVANGSTPFCNFGATEDGPAACGIFGSDVWFHYTATNSGTVTVSTCNSDFDTVLAVYPDGCPVGGAIACNDDDVNTHCSTNIFNSYLTFPSTAGAQYLVRVGGYDYGGGTGGQQGSGFLNISSSGCGSADFNCDGDLGTDADIESFFSCLAGHCPAPPCTSSADFNGDGDIGTDADIEAFFRVLAGGNC